jgi:predicted RNA-binding protein with TRAM domain
MAKAIFNYRNWTRFCMVHRSVRGGKFKVKYENQCPVQLGEELEVNIIDVCPSGDGRTKIRGYSILVPKAKPGDRVKIRVTQVGEKTGIGEIIK